MSEDGRRAYKRDPAYRIFVNRNLRMEAIKFFGFDMDYTLAVYKSPVFEALTFGLVVRRLIDIGYPEEMLDFKYNPQFPVRGLWFDRQFGNLLKVDGFGNILVGLHGLKYMKPSEIEEFYPNKFLHLNDRIYVLNTLFNLPETHLVSCLIDYFDNHPKYIRAEDKTGIKSGEVFMSYRSIFEDIRNAVDWVHYEGDLKQIVLEDKEKYIVNDPRIRQLLTQIKNSGKQAFLLTNSGYAYTNGVMEYLIGEDWTKYFDITIVDARKPKWFAEGTVFRKVDRETGALRIGSHVGPLQQGQIYSGGSCDVFRRLAKARGKDVLYIGDHVFGDVLRSKKVRGWRTFLVVPELTHELTVWTEKRPIFERLSSLDIQLASAYKDLDSYSHEKPLITNILESFSKVTHEMDREYGILGSIFRSGSRTTFFSSQVERFADLYASSCCNLVHYPLFYFFRAPMTLLPHESTVDHSSVMSPICADNPINTEPPQQDVLNDSKFCHEEEEDATSNSETEDSRIENCNDEFSDIANFTKIVAISPSHIDGKR